MSRRRSMPRRTPYMPGQSMYAGAWDVLMLTFSVRCSMGLSLNPPGGPAAVAAVAILRCRRRGSGSRRAASSA